MTSKARTILGVALFVPLACIILATLACLPAPVGDPEKSTVDNGLNGAWQAATQDKDETVMVLMRSWDAHTYLMQYMSVKTGGGKETHQMMDFKAWLTTIGNATFITCQPMEKVEGIPTEDKPFWVVMRLDKTASGMDTRMVKQDSELMKDKEKREEIEAVIKAHLDDKTLYGDTMSFKKLGKADEKALSDFMSKFNNP